MSNPGLTRKRSTGVDFGEASYEEIVSALSSNAVFFRGVRESIQVIATVTPTTVLFSSDIDTEGGYNPATGTYTFIKPGFYSPRSLLHSFGQRN